MTSLTVTPSTALTANQTITIAYTLVQGTEPTTSLGFLFVSADGKSSRTFTTTNPSTGTISATVGADWANAVYTLTQINLNDSLNNFVSYPANGVIPIYKLPHPWFYPVGGSAPDLSGTRFTVTGAGESVHTVTLNSLSTSAPSTAGQPILINYSITGGSAATWNLTVFMSAPDGAMIDVPSFQGTGSGTGTIAIPTTSGWVNGTYKFGSVFVSDSNGVTSYSRGSTQVPTSTDCQLTGGVDSAVYPQLNSLAITGPTTVGLGQSAQFQCAVTAGSSPITQVTLTFMGPDQVPVAINASAGGLLSFPIQANSIDGQYTFYQAEVVDATGHSVAYYANGQIAGFPASSGHSEPAPFGGNFVVSGALKIPPFITSQPVGGTVQPGQTLALNVGLVNGPSATFQWYQGQSGDTSQPQAGSNSSPFQPPAPSSTTSYWARITNVYGSVDTAAATITVAYSGAQPTIYTQPQAVDESVGGGAFLSVYAAGPEPLSYQWYKDGAAIAGATLASLRINAGALSDSGAYTVTVTNPSGTATSNPTSVVFYTTPVVVTQPASQTIAYGGTAIFSVQATGGDLRYEWSGPGISDLTTITGSTLTLTNVQQTYAGSYRVTVSNSAGNVLSAAATLTINGGPLPVVTVSSTAYGTIGQYFGLQVNSTNPPFTYAASGLPPGLTIGQSGNIAGTPTSAGTFAATITVTNAGGATSVPVSFTISTGPYAPVFTLQPASQTAVLHTTVTLTAAASGTPKANGYLLYQWNLNGQPISGATSSSYVIAVTSDAVAGDYTVDVAGSVGTTRSVVAHLTVDSAHSAPYITSPSSDVTVNAGDTATLAYFAAGTGPLTFAWKHSAQGDVALSATGSTASIPHAGVDDEGNYYAIISNAYGQIETGPIRLTVNYLLQPAAQTIAAGQTATVALANSAEVVTYQWFQSTAGQASRLINGATSASYTPPPLTASTTYYVNVYGHVFGAASSTATINVGNGGSGGPQFAAQPQSSAVTTGSSVTFTAAASGTATYQWYFNGTAIAGATGLTYSVTNAQLANSGAYYVLATNGSGSTASSAAMLTVAPGSAPAIGEQPSSQFSAPGSTVVFNVSINGTISTATAGLGRAVPQLQPSDTYQWYLNGVPIAGATGPTYATTASTATAGSYTCLISNGQGTISTSPATLSLAAPNADPGRLINLSVLALDAPGNQLLTLGFVSGGGGAGAQNVLLRVSGPALAAFNVANLLPDPVLTLFSGTTALISNNQWALNQSAVIATDLAVGAFALTDPNSLDAALPLALPGSGSYTIQATSRTQATGNVLAEVYDATPSGTYTSATPRLINLSCLDYVGSGAVLTAGFTVGGSTNRTVLIRASGPALAAAPFNLLGTMPDPQLAVFRSSAQIMGNAGWNGSTPVANAATAVAAFPWASATSTDSAVLMTLAPGTYTAQVMSASGTAGLTLIEVYEVQ